MIISLSLDSVESAREFKKAQKEMSVTKIEQRYQFSWMVPCAVIHARYLWNVQNDLNLRKIQPNVSGNIP